MTRPQVRLDADVAEALQRDGARLGSSLSTMANTVLRRALSGVTVTHAPAVEVVKPTRKAALVPAQAVGAGGCTHPAGSRLGLHCAACGVTLPKPKPVRLGR